MKNEWLKLEEVETLVNEIKKNIASEKESKKDYKIWFAGGYLNRKKVPNITDVFSRKTLDEEIVCFLTEMAEKYNNDDYDFKPIYDKYPRVKIGCRRALVFLQKHGFAKK